MSLDLKESKLRLSEAKFSKKDIKDGIVSIRQNHKKEKKETE
ncbi:4710_t:CDS:1, partial [Gigaspora rosea]